MKNQWPTIEKEVTHPWYLNFYLALCSIQLWYFSHYRVTPFKLLLQTSMCIFQKPPTVVNYHMALKKDFLFQLSHFINPSQIINFMSLSSQSLSKFGENNVFYSSFLFSMSPPASSTTGLYNCQLPTCLPGAIF